MTSAQGKASAVLGGIALLVAGMVAWATPRATGDLYMALAGGQDVLAGKLGKPDDWSFSTAGRVWVNSSWGSDLLFALVNRASGEIGLLALKAILLGAIGLLVARCARERGASWGASFTAAALALAASPQDFILRPNLIGLLFVPLLLLLLGRPEKRPVWLVWIALLFLLWGNAHGGFVFGLLVMALWVLTETGHGEASDSNSRWLPWAGLGLALLVALFANPFGPRNLFLQFVVPRSQAWRHVNEWGPLWAPRTAGVAFPVLFVVLAAIAVLGQIRRMVRREWSRSDDLFDLCVVGVGIILALVARRLVPWTAVAMVPPAARTLDGLMPKRQNALAMTPAQVVLVVYLIVANRWVPGHYVRNHPLFPNENMLDRMVLHGLHFPGGAAAFLNANHIEARAFNEWRWEGYLREHAPGMKVLIGGRAHQVYDEATFWKYRDLMAGTTAGLSEDGSSPGLEAKLHALDISVAIVPLIPEYAKFCGDLWSGDARWAYVYMDRHTAVFADPSHPATRDLVASAATGQLIYPDSASAALSRAMCLSSFPEARPDTTLPLLLQAVSRRPTGYVYPLLVQTALRTGVPADTLIAYLEGEDSRLANMAPGAAEENALLQARRSVEGELERLYRDEFPEKRQRLAVSRQFINQRMKTIAKAYPAYFWSGS